MANNSCRTLLLPSQFAAIPVQPGSRFEGDAGIAPIALTGGHPLAEPVRAAVVQRPLSVKAVHRLTPGVSSSSACLMITAGRPVRDRVARAVGVALGVLAPHRHHDSALGTTP